jgi:hypothetical protein
MRSPVTVTTVSAWLAVLAAQRTLPRNLLLMVPELRLSLLEPAHAGLKELVEHPAHSGGQRWEPRAMSSATTSPSIQVLKLELYGHLSMPLFG